jgi:hypothetical protein
LLTAVLIGATPFSAGAEDAAIPNPEAIFERARTTLSEMAYPPLLDYRIAVTLHAGGTSRTDHYSGEVEPATGECRVHSFSVEEAANPYVPSGINVYFGLSAGAGSGHNGIGVAPPPEIPIVRKNVNPTPAPVTFGIPDISPLYSFGIRAGGRQLANDDDASTLKTIGRVIVLGRRYNVRLIGRVPLDGVDEYHLGCATCGSAHPPMMCCKRASRATSRTNRRRRCHGSFTSSPSAERRTSGPKPLRHRYRIRL